MSESYVSRFERGLVDNPTQATLEHIATSIGTTVPELIRESEVSGMIIKDRTRRDFSRYMEVFERFPAWRQEQARRIMDALFSEVSEKQLSRSDCTRSLVRKQVGDTWQAEALQENRGFHRWFYRYARNGLQKIPCEMG